MKKDKPWSCCQKIGVGLLAVFSVYACFVVAKHLVVTAVPALVRPWTRPNVNQAKLNYLEQKVERIDDQVFLSIFESGGDGWGSVTTEDLSRFVTHARLKELLVEYRKKKH